MKTKKIIPLINKVLPQTEIKKAFKVLDDHGVKYWTFDDSEFEEEWIYDMWESYGIKKPTAKHIKKAKELAYEYVLDYSWEAMEDALYEVCRIAEEKRSKGETSLLQLDRDRKHPKKKKGKK